MQLRLIRSLSVVVAIVIPDHDGRAVKSFAKGLEAAHWKVSKQTPALSLLLFTHPAIPTLIHLS